MRSIGDELVARPEVGRVFEGTRRVRLGDVSPAGRLRLDAATRYLQDVSADDTADAALPDAQAWVVRRTIIEVRAFPRYLEALRLATWCSGTGSHYAERRVQMLGDAGGRLEAASLWVHVDPVSGRPRRLSPDFDAVYRSASGGRRVKSRRLHGDPAGSVPGRAWALRFTDFDVLRHVNNSAYWEIVEEVLATRRDLRAPLRAELEHRFAVERGSEVEVVVEPVGDRDATALWILADGIVAATALITRPGDEAQSVSW